jgi:hypothetical protein
LHREATADENDPRLLNATQRASVILEPELQHLERKPNFADVARQLTRHGSLLPPRAAAHHHVAFVEHRQSDGNTSTMESVEKQFSEPPGGNGGISGPNLADLLDFDEVMSVDVPVPRIVMCDWDDLTPSEQSDLIAFHGMYGIPAEDLVRAALQERVLKGAIERQRIQSALLTSPIICTCGHHTECALHRAAEAAEHDHAFEQSGNSLLSSTVGHSSHTTSTTQSFLTSANVQRTFRECNCGAEKTRMLANWLTTQVALTNTGVHVDDLVFIEWLSLGPRSHSIPNLGHFEQLLPEVTHHLPVKHSLHPPDPHHRRKDHTGRQISVDDIALVPHARIRRSSSGLLTRVD